MKKIILGIFLLLITLSCSSNSVADEPTTHNELNIPETFRGVFQGVQTNKVATITQTTLEVSNKRIDRGENEYFNGSNHYEVDLPDGEKLVLLKGNGYVGITIYKSDNSWFISDYFE